METILGIDLGTTNSEVSVIHDGKPEIIPVDNETMMPSCVGLDLDNNLLVGKAARNQMAVNPESTILSIKRKMGEPVTFSLGGKEYTPEEVSSFILEKLKQSAQDYLGKEIVKAVITVPAYFNDEQRKATKRAGVLAGLDIQRIINEPTAAALAYESDHANNQNILIYDLGGGTFDVSVVVVEDGIVEVKASHGDTHLGGDDFDKLLINHIADNFEEQNNIDLRADARSYNRLWQAVEKAKCELSDKPFAKIQEEYICEKHHLDFEISRHDYEDMIQPLLKKTVDCVSSSLSDASFLPGAIDKVILVGGATRTPLVSKMLQEAFGKRPHHEINPDLIVAWGASVQAGIIGGHKTNSILVDITPYTFGTDAFGEYGGVVRKDVYVPIIHRNSTLPMQKSEVFYTMVDNQKHVEVRVFQGENPLSKENTLIGNFTISDLSDVPEGNEIIICLNLDLDGILTVTAEEKCTGLSKTVTMDTGGLKKQSDKGSAGENMETRSPAAENGTPANETAKRTKELQNRVEEVIDKIDKTDSEELRSLIADAQNATHEEKWETVSELNESLSDMLFYLED